MLSSLGQTLVKLTAPGVPDFYQGSELWDLNLVDPDNRRPVDWGERLRLLDEVLTALAAGRDRAAFADELVKTKADGRVKLFVIHQGLAFRRAHRALFETGAYRPLEVRGAYAEHVCAFARVADGAAAVTVIPRLLARRGVDAVPLGVEYWADTSVELPRELAGRFANALTGERLATVPAGEDARLLLAEILGTFPVALLEREGGA
jgi:(1->4)-alpha-D-glucan 1-alpha-D-glucosylmutase